MKFSCSRRTQTQEPFFHSYLLRINSVKMVLGRRNEQDLGGQFFLTAGGLWGGRVSSFSLSFSVHFTDFIAVSANGSVGSLIFPFRPLRLARLSNLPDGLAVIIAKASLPRIPKPAFGTAYWASIP